jgi:hypothetical protein
MPARTLKTIQGSLELAGGVSAAPMMEHASGPMSERRRTAAKLIRFHPQELALITEAARACGLTPARFIRETVLGARPSPRPHAAQAPLLHELARIARRLDQLARRPLAGQDGLAERLRTALDDLGALVRQVVGDRRRGAGRPTP